MKNKNIIQRLCLFIFALVLTMPAGAQGGSGNGNEPFTIASKDDWKIFCDRVNNGETYLNAKMTTDVDLGEKIAIVGYSSHYSGTFDGQGHTLTVNWNSKDHSSIAPFYSMDNVTIKNLHVKGQITSRGNVSGLILRVHETATVSGCTIDMTLKNTEEMAGLIYEIYGAQVTITDCLVKGDLYSSSNNIGGFVYSQGGTCNMTNCLYAGTNYATIRKSYTFCDGANLENCYYLNPCGRPQGLKITDEQLKNGYVAHRLQSTRSEQFWGQELGKDNEPMLTNKIEKRVYRVEFAYNGKVKATRYVNRGGTVASLPTVEEILGTEYNPANTYELTFTGNFSTDTHVNADITVDVSLKVNNTVKIFEITSKADWKTFCDRVKDGEAELNAKMTQDIDLEETVEMVGDTDHPYSATFDGQGHTLSINWEGGQFFLSPFVFVGNATIKNLHVKGKITSGQALLSGLIGAMSGTNTISGCSTDVAITNNRNAQPCGSAGMVILIDSEANVTITDCLVKGSINGMTDTSKKEMAGFVGTQEGICTLTNCLYAGENNAEGGGYTFAMGANLKNCYYLSPCGESQGKPVTEEQLASGYVAKKLQGDRTDACYWAQQLGDMLDLYNVADKSNTNYVYYDASNKRWACDDFRLADDKPLPIGIDFTATNTTYERIFTAGKGTFCLPYNLPAHGFSAYRLSDTQGNVGAVSFEKVNDKLEAYKPYLIAYNGTLKFVGQNIQVKAFNAATLTTSADKYSLVGTVTGIDNAAAAATNAYILQDDGKFHKVTTANTAATIPAYHAYIVRGDGSGAKQLSVILDGETTGIDDLTNDATGIKHGAVYDLQGRRVADRLDDNARSQLPTGVYIVGGKKVIVK